MYFLWALYYTESSLTACMCLCFRGCISNRRMMDSMLSPEPQRMWVVFSWHSTNSDLCSQIPQWKWIRVLIYPEFVCPLLLQFLPPQSPADQCKKIHAGDEVIQVNHQTVVSVKSFQTQHCSHEESQEMYFPRVSSVNTYCKCLLFSILCYVEEMSRYMMPATTTTTAAMVLPVLCLCRYVG